MPNMFLSMADKRAKDDARHRHEGINSFLKSFGVLSLKFRHNLQTHQNCFAACAVVTQLGIDDGSVHPWQVRY